MINVTPIVALDVPTLTVAKQIVSTLDDQCDFYKVGLELFSAEGPAVVHWLRGEGKRVFVDLKLHDIPNTVQSAARSVARLGASLLTVHASGGEAMIRAAVQGAFEGSIDSAHRHANGGMTATGCGILAVTVLTSLDAHMLGAAWGLDGVSVDAEVQRLAGIARKAEALGVVCSGHELASVKAAHGDKLAALVPGIRLAGGKAHDQQRVMTPGAAAAAGADYIILGRAVTGAPDPVEAMEQVWEELGAGGQPREGAE
ncbi:MAG: orotidine-5'-phosphate decarboxylase [Gemmatimonas sp.]